MNGHIDLVKDFMLYTYPIYLVETCDYLYINLRHMFLYF